MRFKFPAVSALLLAGLAALFSASLNPTGLDQSRATYIGADACGTCHEDNHKLWSESLHSRMIQPVAKAKVLGDFENANTLQHNGWRFEMVKENGRYLIREWDDAGKLTLYPVDFTLGSKRIQHYLSRRPDGRIRVTFPTWDVLNGKWFHSSKIIPTAGHHAEISIQIWNQHCYNCHVSQEKQGFDIETNTYDTTFTEAAINCEMCHGPGSVHAARMDKDPEDLNRAIVHPGKLEPEKQMLVCVQCHMPRVIVQNGFHPGKNYYDHYMPTLMQFFIDRTYDPPMWGDGRMRRFATEGGALWQSQCFLKGGATCISCHNPHINTIERDERFDNPDLLCTQCHEGLKKREEVATHTHHEVNSAGSKCISCHMPKETVMMTDKERDHTISIPVPENTIQYQIPNACTTCHTDQKANWAVDWMDRWYPSRPKVNAKRADAFILARERDARAVPLLIELLNDAEENRVVRGSAAGFLGEFSGAEVASALVNALRGRDVIVRAEAARSLSEVRHPSAGPALKVALSDANQIVRLNAFFALIKMGVLEMEGRQAAQFEKVRTEFEAFLESFPDVYSIRVNLGTYHAIYGRHLVALQEYRNARKLQPQLPLAHYYVGVTLAQLGLLQPALESFATTLELDPNFRNTADLVKQVKEALENRKMN